MTRHMHQATLAVTGGAIKVDLVVTGAEGQDYAGACVELAPVASTLPESMSVADARAAMALDLRSYFGRATGVPAGLRRGIRSGAVSLEMPAAVLASPPVLGLPRKGVPPVPAMPRRGRHDLGTTTLTRVARGAA